MLLRAEQENVVQRSLILRNGERRTKLKQSLQCPNQLALVFILSIQSTLHQILSLAYLQYQKSPSKLKQQKYYDSQWISPLSNSQ